MTEQQTKWIVKRHTAAPVILSNLPARVNAPDVFLEISIDRTRLDAWELSRLDDGDLIPEWIIWWLRSASWLASRGSHCSLAYLPRRRWLASRGKVAFMPLTIEDLTSLVADQLGWNSPAHAGLFWSRTPPASPTEWGYDGCILPAEVCIFVITNEAGLNDVAWWAEGSS